MVEQGADIIDIGGESTRPGSKPLELEEELRRVIPVIKSLAAEVDVPISIDTYKAVVAQRAIEAGAEIINDISGLNFDPDLAKVAAKEVFPLSSCTSAEPRKQCKRISITIPYFLKSFSL